MEPIRVLLADDHALFRKGVASLLRPLEDMEVAGEAGDGQEALERGRELMPDVILMDIHMPGWDGLKATRLIKCEMPYVKIVMLTASDDDRDLFEAIKSGAHGYLLKEIEPEELFAVLRSVHQGEAPISRLTAAMIIEEFACANQEEPPDSGSGESLSLLEGKVLHLLASGTKDKEIASRLNITENTLKNHQRNILLKLHLQNRIQTVAYAVREGIYLQPRFLGAAKPIAPWDES